MNTRLILRSSTDRLDRLRADLVGARIDAVDYVHTVRGGLDPVPAEDPHEVDCAVVLHLSTGVFQVAWERDDLTEGLSVEPWSFAVPSADVSVVPVSRSPQWRDRVGAVIADLRFLWHGSEVNRPESLRSLRLDLGAAGAVTIAPGELPPAGEPPYHPNSLLVVFDSSTAASYRPGSVKGSPESDAISPYTDDGDPWGFVQHWYAEQCNGDWEHEFGIRIATLDNPGWTFSVDLGETDLEGRVLARAKVEPGEGRWIWSWSDGRTYECSCDPASVNDAFARFRAFAEGRLTASEDRPEE